MGNREGNGEMKIIFAEDLPSVLDAPFAIYNYDECAAGRENYVDIRRLVREKGWEWLDDVQSSYEAVSAAYLRHTRWWWIAPMSRLDLRPWWQEGVIKPLFFAKAVVEWIRSNPGEECLMLIGCDPMAAVYLEEFDRILEIEGIRRRRTPLLFLIDAFKGTLTAVLKMLVSAYMLLRNHAFMPDAGVDFKTLALYEYLPGLPLSSGYRYFYGSLFDSVEDMERSSIGYCCLEYTGRNLKVDRTEFAMNKSTIFLLDNISAADIASGVFKSIHLILVTWAVAFRNIPCAVNGSASKLFWRNYLFHELGRAPFLSGICAYKALKTLFRRSPSCRTFIYPYEEKGVERAFLYASAEHGIKTVGYTPHPQYRTALALRDTFSNRPPRPASYAVCGPAYADYFSVWAKKEKGRVSIWGSSKASKGEVKARRINRSVTTALLLLSHPNELRIFHSWLRADKRITNGVQYIVRYYRGGNTREFEEVLSMMMKEYGCVMESRGSLDEDLTLSDITAFCATSAGPQAVNRGHLSVYLDLNDFFEINPCFDELEAMLPCANAAGFARRLDEIRNMGADELNGLHSRQVSLAERIFSPVRADAIKEALGAEGA